MQAIVSGVVDHLRCNDAPRSTIGYRLTCAVSGVVDNLRCCWSDPLRCIRSGGQPALLPARVPALYLESCSAGLTDALGFCLLLVVPRHVRMAKHITRWSSVPQIVKHRAPTQVSCRGVGAQGGAVAVCVYATGQGRAGEPGVASRNTMRIVCGAEDTECPHGRDYSSCPEGYFRSRETGPWPRVRV